MSSTTPTPASLGKLPIALTLPEESWIQTLLELDYCELKKASRICKKLQRLTQDSKFDQVLFRAGPPQVPTPRGAYVELHPMIDEIDGVFLSLETAKMLNTDRSSKIYHPSSYSTVLDEFVTSPASRTIAISFTDPLYRSWDLYKPKGITVRDFLQHFAEYWVRSQDRDTPMSRRCLKAIDLTTHVDPLVRRTVWTKWDFVQAQGGDEALFQVDSLDW